MRLADNPNPFCDGWFLAREETRPLFETWRECMVENPVRPCLDQPWLNEIIKDSGGYTPIPKRDHIFPWPGEREPLHVPQTAHIAGREDRVGVIKNMSRSVDPYRELCIAYGWEDEIKARGPFPEGYPIDIVCISAGIGDGLAAAHAAAALQAQNPLADVNICPLKRNQDFIRVFWPKVGPLRSHGLHYHLPPQPWWSADGKDGRNRITNWARACGVEDAKPAPPSIDAEALVWARGRIAHLPRPLALLSPVSYSGARRWVMGRWVRLARSLEDAGWGVLFVDAPDGLETKEWPFERVYNEGAQREAALYSLCDLAVGNDSGMAHLAASLSRPSLALCGPTAGKWVFGWYRTARWIQGRTRCTGCYFEKKRGWDEVRCNKQCRALASITTDAVFGACLSMVPQTERATAEAAS
jgi:hypothetical protein